MLAWVGLFAYLEAMEGELLSQANNKINKSKFIALHRFY